MDEEKSHRSLTPGFNSLGETDSITETTTKPPTESLETSSDTTKFEPIHPAPQTTSTSRRCPSIETISTIRRERTNNGWGVDDLEENSIGGGGAVAPYNQPDQPFEHDPYEVGWDGGDSDPLCPRSMPTWRKWLIIGITSVGSFCV